MSNYAIRVQGLGKQYTIGAYQGRYKSLRDSLMRSFTEPLRRIGGKNGAGKADRTIWALKDVSFDIEHGEVVGIIGRNGAGKSTLLKLLARITEPTEGEIRMRGRVGSLLEVGTGFHPELTGRENIFLNGAILGMSRAEIGRKFDEIVDFAEIEKFIDTPAKHYSSGMYMRLAFAVAAHLEPEILLVDEVLAVGDAQFQKKCLGKMGDVAKEGRTVLFVSHQIAMIKTLCRTAIILDHGKMAWFEDVSMAVTKYVNSTAPSTTSTSLVTIPLNRELRSQITSVGLRNTKGELINRFDALEKINVEISYQISEPIAGVAVILILKRFGELLFVSFDTDLQPRLLDGREPGTYITQVQLPSPLKPGNYSIDVNIGRLNGQGVSVNPDIFQFEITEESFDTSMISFSSKRPGVMAVALSWETLKRD